VALRANGDARARHQRSHRARIWARRAVAAARASVLVPVLRGGHGDGLAFLGHHHETPAELAAVGEATGIDAQALATSSRLVAKVDGAAVQDGFGLYLHAFFVSVEGAWCVVQQGMNESLREARRYHWQSESLNGFFDSPHSGIEGRNVGVIVNLADARAQRSRLAALELARANPDRTVGVLRRWRELGNLALPLFPELEAALPEPEAVLPAGHPEPHLDLPHRHEIRATDVSLRRLHATLAAAAERGPRDFAELLLQPGVGARTVAALAFVAEIVHGAPSRFSDPARFALAHGGKDAHPFPVPLKVYDATLGVLKRAVERAHLGSSETLGALRRLDEQARLLEARTSGPSFEAHVTAERSQSDFYGGRRVSH